jgi:GntR family transcriptional regulator
MARTRHDTFPEVPLPQGFDNRRAKGRQLREMLESMVGQLPPGTLLPSERSIAERFGVARMTVRQEINDLAARGLIRRVMGAGTFVAQTHVSHGTMAGSFSHDMHRRGLTPGARVLSAHESPATAFEAERLRVKENDPVVHLKRLRTADGLPMAVEHTHLPSRRFPGLAESVGDNTSLYAILAERWSVKVASATHRVIAIALDDNDAALLGVPTGLPSFLVERTAFDDTGAVVEWGRSRYRGDRYDIVFDVHPEWASGKDSAAEVADAQRDEPGAEGQ